MAWFNETHFFRGYILVGISDFVCEVINPFVPNAPFLYSLRIS